ncbi:hypothetical protein, partial [Laspinema olomoucense]|uniref:hypothetical protein n=1 Tax=Laspinema olomoucense TaxID=3231600 RepID=UPI0021BBA6BD
MHFCHLSFVICHLSFITGSGETLSPIQTTSGDALPEIVSNVTNSSNLFQETPDNRLLLTENLQFVAGSEEKLSEIEATSGNAFPETVPAAANSSNIPGENLPHI